MAKVVTPITARVEVIGKIKTGNYGEYRSVLFLDESQPQGSEESRIWKNLSDAEVEPLRKGMRVQLVPAGTDKNGKDKHNILLLDTPPVRSPQPASPGQTPPTPPQAPKRPGNIPPTWSDQQKRELSAEVCDHADMFRFCMEVVASKFAGVADQRDYRAIATTLYLNIVQRRLAEE